MNSEKLIWIYQVIMLLCGGLMILFFYLNFLNISKIFMFIFLGLFSLFLLMICVGLVSRVKKEDLDYFRSVVGGVVGGLIVLLLIKINFSSYEDFWLSFHQNMQLIIWGLLIIVVGYLICRDKA